MQQETVAAVPCNFVSVSRNDGHLHSEGFVGGKPEMDKLDMQQPPGSPCLDRIICTRPAGFGGKPKLELHDVSRECLVQENGFALAMLDFWMRTAS